MKKWTRKVALRDDNTKYKEIFEISFNGCVILQTLDFET